MYTSTTQIKTVHAFGKDYDFIDPINFDGHILPLRAILDILQPYIDDESTFNLESMSANQASVIRNRLNQTSRLTIQSIRELLRFYRNYIDSRDKQDFIKDFNRYYWIARVKTENVIEVLTEHPDDDLYTFIRDVNINVNEKCDTVVRQRDDGTYYIDDSWEDLSDDFIDDIIKTFEDLCLMYDRSCDSVDAIIDEHDRTAVW